LDTGEVAVQSALIAPPLGAYTPLAHRRIDTSVTADEMSGQ
jgi:hypothetical protein